jgi:alpha-L-rhamnosidase
MSLMQIHRLSIGGALLLAGMALAAEDLPLTVERWRCEGEVRPLSVSQAPRFSWTLKASQRGCFQMAYQILVASTPEGLKVGKADLWDSGKVASDQSINVPYAGKPLGFAQTGHWQVRVWDNHGNTSPFSAPAYFETALLTQADWGAKWIGEGESVAKLIPGQKEEANGFHAEVAKTADTIKWVQVDLGKSLPLESVRLYPAVPGNFGPKTPGFGFPVRFKIEVDDDPAFATAKIIHDATAEDFPNPGATVPTFSAAGITARYVRVTATRLWRQGASDSFIFALDELKVYSGGGNAALGVPVTAFDSIENWGWGKTCLTDGRYAVVPVGEKSVDRNPAVMLRREFEIKGGVKRARAYICGLGYNELYINGEKVGDSVLDPGLTDYDQRALYVVHDLDQSVKPGRNAIGVVLGGGWYDLPTTDIWGWHRAPWRRSPRLLVRLVFELNDGTTQTLVSDQDWRVSTNGPIVFNSVRAGESYDARREQKDWATAGFDDQAWKSAQVLIPPKGRLTPQNLPPIKVNRTLAVKKVTEPKPGVYLFDFGQDFSGWARVTVVGPAGTTLRLQYGERLKSDGTLEQGGINAYTKGRFQTDEYILKGGGMEVWEPRFCYHAFRYVEVTGLPGAPTPDMLQGRVVYSSVAPAGTFTCSNELLNRIQEACVWTLISNLHSIPQDCPHREKQGWMADGLSAAPQAMFNFDMEAFYRKWIDDMRDAQNPANGGMPSVVPSSGWSPDPGGGYSCPCWGSVCVILPWLMYHHYGDAQFIEANYSMMKAYTVSLSKRATEHIVSFGLGDWLEVGSGSRPSRTPIPLTGTAYYFNDARLVSQAAALLGKPDEAQTYQTLALGIQNAFQNKFFDPATSCYATNSQTAQALPLVIGLVPKALRQAVLGSLVSNVTGVCAKHISSGIVGTRYVLEALTELGRADLAYAMVTQPDIPGWAAMLRNGNGTISEDWGSGMSLNHPAFTCVSAWFYQGLAGINGDPAAPGFKRFIIRPQIVGDLTFAKASYRSAHGLIKSEWIRKGDAVELHLEIPANTTATVVLPGDGKQPVLEGGKPVCQSDGVSSAAPRDGRAVYSVGSGIYDFAFKL